MPRYLLHYTLTHESFRLPELTSIAQLHGFKETMKISLPDDLGGKPRSVESTNVPRPFIIVDLKNDEQAKILAERCILIKAIYELWAYGTSYEELHEMNQRPEIRALWEPYKLTPWKMNVTAVQHAFPAERMNQTIKSFAYMDYETIVMDNPGIILWVCEEYEYRVTKQTKLEGDGDFLLVYFGRLVAEGSGRRLITKFDVKKRAYYGNTSMEAEMSLLMANQALAGPGRLIYDPFVGTGSMLYTCAYFGALVFGSDIDGRQMRGKDPSSLGIARSAAQYGVLDRILDCATFDITYNPWRTGGIFDGLIADPPYGVRAGAKRIGSGIVGKPLNPVPRELPNGILAHTKPTYVPPTRAYELSDLTLDLIELARYLLRPGGRLVFFLPTVTEDYSEMDLPVCEGMNLVSNSIQDFGKWSRRLITMERTSDPGVHFDPPAFEDRAWKKREAALMDHPPETSLSQEPEHVPAHRDFREKYFLGFKKEDSK